MRAEVISNASRYTYLTSATGKYRELGFGGRRLHWSARRVSALADAEIQAGNTCEILRKSQCKSTLHLSISKT